LTLLPFTALIRYQALPDTDLPAHMALQPPPLTVVATVTFVSVLMAARSLAVVQGLVRRLTPQAATFVTLAPSTVPGTETAVMARRRKADRIAVVTGVSRDGRPVRRGA